MIFLQINPFLAKRIIVPNKMAVIKALDTLAETCTDPLDTISIPQICKRSGLLDHYSKG